MPDMERRWIEDRLSDLSGKTKNGLAAAMKLAPSRVTEIIQGKRSVKTSEVAALADYLELKWAEVFQKLERVPALEIVKEPLIRVPVIGEVKAGEWGSSLEWWSEEDQETVTVERPDRAHERFYALRVLGTSMNLVFPEGTILICVHCEEYAGELEDGDYVIIEQHENGDFEATCKQLQRDTDGRWWAWPRSTDPEWQAPLLLSVESDLPDDGGASPIRATGIVVSAQLKLKP